MVAFGDRAVAHHGPAGEPLAVLGGLLRRPASQSSREIAGIERIARAAGVERMELRCRLGERPVGKHDALGPQLHDDFLAPPGDPVLADRLRPVARVEAPLVVERGQAEARHGRGAVAPDARGFRALPQPWAIVAVEGDLSPPPANLAREREHGFAPFVGQDR